MGIYLLDAAVIFLSVVYGIMFAIALAQIKRTSDSLTMKVVLIKFFVLVGIVVLEALSRGS